MLCAVEFELLSAFHDSPMDDDALAALQLNLIPGLGPRLQSLLIARFGSPADIFRATGQELLRVDRIGPKISAEITQSRSLDAARREAIRAEAQGIDIFSRDSASYPPPLNEIPDPPPVLYSQGDLLAADQLAVGIVGSRQCTHYGRTQAERLAAGFARAGVTVISGMARGIDAAAHRGALGAGGRTIAVWATGLLQIYPPDHKDLAVEIAANGALVTESPLDRTPQKGLFPQRNRIISGMSLGVIIVEAGRKSGALHTARHAMEQGREVFAVPGRVDSRASDGCHDLIRDGVVLVRSVDDVLESLGPLIQPVETAEQRTVYTPRELNLNDQERTVLDLIDAAPTPIDQVLEHAEMDSSRVLSTLTVLEMKKLVRRLPGSFVERSYG